MSGESWFFAGLTSSFINITPSTDQLSHSPKQTTKVDLRDYSEDDQLSHPDNASSCKILQTCSSSSVLAEAEEVSIDEASSSQPNKDQVLVFQYRGKFHAITHECPHQSYPLSKGSIYDIEDFGIILSAGITCPKHGWAFDLHTGDSDKGGYKLKLWDVQLRECQSMAKRPVPRGEEEFEPVREVWVRRKRQRIG